MNNSEFNPQLVYDQVIKYVFSDPWVVAPTTAPLDVVARIKEEALQIVDGDGCIDASFPAYMKPIDQAFVEHIWTALESQGLPAKLEIRFSLEPFEGSRELGAEDEFIFEISKLDSAPDLRSVVQMNALIGSVYLPLLDEEIILESDEKIRTVQRACSQALEPYIGKGLDPDFPVKLTSAVCALANMLCIQRSGCGLICVGTSPEEGMLSVQFKAKGSWNHQPYFEAEKEYEEIEAQLASMYDVVEDPTSTLLSFKKSALSLRRLLNSTPEIFSSGSPYHDLVFSLQGEDADVEDARAALNELAGFLQAFTQYKRRKNSCRYRN